MYNINTTGSTVNPQGDEIINNACFTTSSVEEFSTLNYCCSRTNKQFHNNIDNRKYLLFIDKLTIRYYHEYPLDFKQLNKSKNHFRFEYKSKHNNPNFRDCYQIYYNTSLFGEININPLNQSIEKDSIAITVNNHFLYTHWEYILRELEWLLSLTFIKISWLDLALDSNLIKRVMWLCREYLQNQVIIINNDKIQISGKAFNKPNRSWDAYFIGSRRSNKWFSCYNKSNEIKQRSDKQYISNTWQELGLEVVEDVYRLELHLKDDKLYKYNLQLEHLFDSDKLLSLFKDEWEQYITFYKAKLRDVKSVTKKGRLIGKSRKLEPIHWNQIIFEYQPLNTYSFRNNNTQEAKRNITYQVKEILKRNNASATKAMIGSFEYSDWDSTLVKHLEKKSKEILGNKLNEEQYLNLRFYLYTLRSAYNDD